MGNLQGIGQSRRPLLLIRRRPLQIRHLLRPGFDFLLADGEQVAQLVAAPLHFPQAPVEDFDLLPSLGQFQTSLGQMLPLAVALGPLIRQTGLAVLDFLPLVRGSGLRLLQINLGLGPSGLGFVPGPHHSG